MYSKMHGRICCGGNGCRLSIPSSEMTTTSPFCTSRTKRAPMMSSAHRLGREDVFAFEFADDERSDAERVARADQLLVGDRDQGIGAFELAQRLDEALDDPLLAAARDEMEDDLGVRRRLVDRAITDQFATYGQGVGEIAVVGDREAARGDFGEQRLDVAQDGLAGRGIADVADRAVAGQALDGAGAGEMVADEAEAALRMEARAVEGDDAGRLLPAMLQGVQAERRDRRGVGMAEYAEDAAFLAQAVGVEVECRYRLRRGRRRSSASSSALLAASGPPQKLSRSPTQRREP